MRQVVQADKDNPNARQALAEALLTLEQFAEASTQLEALVVSQPQSPQVWAALGRSYEGVAREAFAKLQALDLDSPYVWLLAADVMTIEEKYPQAFSLIRKAQVALPTLPGVHHARACVRRERPCRLGRRRAEARRARAAVLRHGARGVRLPRPEAGGRDRAHGDPRPNRRRSTGGHALPTTSPRDPSSPREAAASVERYVVRAGIARDQNQPLEAASSCARH